MAAMTFVTEQAQKTGPAHETGRDDRVVQSDELFQIARGWTNESAPRDEPAALRNPARRRESSRLEFDLD